MGDKTESGLGWAGLLIIFIVIWLLFGGGFGGDRRGGYVEAAGCTRVSNCEVERQEIIDSYNTQLNTINQGIMTRADASANTQRIMDQQRAQYDAIQGEKMFDLKTENNTLKLMSYFDNKFCQQEAQIADIRCNMLPKPNLYGVSSTCSGQVIPPLCGNCTTC